MSTYSRTTHRCSKCGSRWHTVEHQPATDTMKVICGHCGFLDHLDPLDKKPDPTEEINPYTGRPFEFDPETGAIRGVVGP